MTESCDWCGGEVGAERCISRTVAEVYCSKTCWKGAYTSRYRKTEKGRKIARASEARYRQTLAGREVLRAAIRKYGKTDRGREVSRKASAKHRLTAHGLEMERARTARRRARKLAAFVEDFDRAAVFERDGWVCQLCGGVVDPNVRWPDPLSASVDHIVPLSRGGAHGLDNVQLAHMGCNSRKWNHLAA